MAREALHDVHVRLHEAGQHETPRDVDHVGAGGRLEAAPDGGYRGAGEGDVGVEGLAPAGHGDDDSPAQQHGPNLFHHVRFSASVPRVSTRRAGTDGAVGRAGILRRWAPNRDSDSSTS